MRGTMAAVVTAMALAFAPVSERRVQRAPYHQDILASRQAVARMRAAVERAALAASLWAERKDGQCAVSARYVSAAGHSAPVRLKRAETAPKGARALQARLAASGYHFRAQEPFGEAPLEPKASKQWTVRLALAECDIAA